MELLEMSPLAINDKAAWVQLGVEYEHDFVGLMKFFPGPLVQINPEKATNPYAPDLLYGEELADLKTQTEPFYTAGRYGYDPAFTVSYNRKDYERYGELYPNLRLFFWVRWMDSTRYGVTVPAIYSVRHATVARIADWIRTGEVAEHKYVTRVEDQGGNAKSSFLLDLRWMDEVFTYRRAA